jgi:outer membrane protein assembly factor BamB
MNLRAFMRWLVGAAAGLALAAEAESWPGWRGPRGDGTSAERHLPVQWSSTSNVVWSAPVPGKGHASPIVWGDRVFTVSALPATGERVLLCFDRRTGRLEWQRAVITSPLEKKHALNSHASSTPATDGERVYVAFLDVQEMVVAAYDLEGRLVWRVRPGAFSSMHGFCSSPVLYRDLVIVNGDHDGDSYIVALDRKDGRTIWKTPRDNKTRSYCVPTVFPNLAGRDQVVLSGDRCVASFDPATGRRWWVIDGPTEQFVASVVYNPGAGLLFVTGGYPEHHLLAVRPDGSGNVTGTAIAWRHNRASYVAYVPSPISSGEYFLVVSDPGYACCFEASTGRLAWQEKTGEQHASLISGGGLVYFLNDAGTTTVVRPGPVFQAVATNALEEVCFASPAASDGRLFIRSEAHLYCIGAEEAGSGAKR